MNNLRSLWADSRGKVIVLLIVVWIVASLQHLTANSFIHPLFAVVLMIVFDMCFGWVRRKTVFFSLSSVVTGLLIGLLFDPSGGVDTLVIASLVASISKQFIQLKNRHMFNPAGIGVVVASGIFHEPVAWWAVAWGIAPVILIALWMAPVLWKLKRLWMPLTFIAVYVISNTVFQNIDAAIRLTVDGTVFLFAFIMLPEPMTAVNLGRWRYVWGILVGLLVVLETVIGASLSDPLLVALLVANLIGFIPTRLVTL